jgi:CheY-like chemotaxis protein
MDPDVGTLIAQMLTDLGDTVVAASDGAAAESVTHTRG